MSSKMYLLFNGVFQKEAGTKHQGNFIQRSSTVFYPSEEKAFSNPLKKNFIPCRKLFYLYGVQEIFSLFYVLYRHLLLLL